MDINFNLLGPNVANELATRDDCNLLFGEDEHVLRLPAKELQWEDVAVIAGFFSSKTQARKNGWAGPVPFGFGQRKFGKGRCVWFFNPKE
jgi:hypothetical protein